MMARLRRWDWKGAAIIGGGVVVALLISWVLYAQASQRAQIDGLSRALAAQCRQTKKLGASCVARPPASVRANPAKPTQAVPGPSGPQGPGPTDAQVYAAVAAYFRAHPVTNNTPPSPAVVQRYVDRYLAAHPAPSGPPGSPGATGSAGTNGTNGADGTDGRGISTMACSGTDLIVTYTDSSTQDLGAGSCGQGPAGPKGEPGQPVQSFTYTVPGVAGVGSTTYLCTWDGQSTSQPHYDCVQQ